MNTFNNKVYIVTGAGHSPGIGFQIAHDLLSNGANVIVNSRTFSNEWSVAKYPNLHLLAGDITNVDVQKSIIKYAVDNFNEINGIVNAAALTGAAQYDNDGILTRETWTSNFLINVIAIYELAQRSKPYINNGSIVNISSRAAIQEHVGANLAYVIAKTAMLKLTKRLALDFAPNANVNAICPAFTETTRLFSLLGDNYEAMRDKFIENSPMKKTITPNDISQTALSLMQNKMITGQVIPVCGGTSL